MSKFNFNIDINDINANLLKSKYIPLSQKEAYLPQYIVDLGLPSKTKWCKYNLGVNINKLNKSEDWYGDYYAWGEINKKHVYSLDTYKFLKKIQTSLFIIYQNM